MNALSFLFDDGEVLGAILTCAIVLITLVIPAMIVKHKESHQ